MWELTLLPSFKASISLRYVSFYDLDVSFSLWLEHHSGSENLSIQGALMVEKYFSMKKLDKITLEIIWDQIIWEVTNLTETVFVNIILQTMNISPEEGGCSSQTEAPQSETPGAWREIRQSQLHRRPHLLMRKNTLKTKSITSSQVNFLMKNECWVAAYLLDIWQNRLGIIINTAWEGWWTTKCYQGKG